MNLQEKINQRIEQLEVELEQLNIEFKEEYISGSVRGLNLLDAQLTTVEACIKELKQLLNN